MKAKDLSILIPARNEEFLSKTVHDILQNIEADTEVIIVLDGQWANPPIPSHERVIIVYVSESIGQRAATNLACRLSEAKYVMKTDAHCAFDKGFDVKIIASMQDDWTMVPVMKNLHAFDWVCPSGHRRYQSPSGPCNQCGQETTKDIVWIAKPSPNSTSYCFSPEPKFQYFSEVKKRPEYQKDLQEKGLTETLSLQGSCFMLTREKYWELNVCDESFGSWGSQGIETAVKTWLSGGKVIVNHKTWYAHMFRTQGGDFGFPYHLSGRAVEHAKNTARDLFFNGKWDKQVKPLSWLIEKFWPVYTWKEEDLNKLKEQELKFIQSKEILDKKEPTKGIIFFTDNQLPIKIAHKVQKQLRMISEKKNIPIVSTSLKPMPHFGKNIHIQLPRGKFAYYTQILTALENSDADIIYFCEHDVIYSETHFDFIPPTKYKFYYNQNFWKVRLEDGFAVHWDANQVSGLCAYRKLLLDYYRNKIKEIEENGFGRSFEPGRRDPEKYGVWKSEQPNIDIRHKGTMTKDKWSPNDFRDKSTCINWQEGYEISGWGKVDKMTFF